MHRPLWSKIFVCFALTAMVKEIQAFKNSLKIQKFKFLKMPITQAFIFGLLPKFNQISRLSCRIEFSKH